MRYVVLFNEEAPKSMLEVEDSVRIADVGTTDGVNEEFGPLGDGGPLGVPYQQLERIRVLVSRDGDERELLSGDAIILGEKVYVYDSVPRVGGFYPASGHIARCVLDSLATTTEED